MGWDKNKWFSLGCEPKTPDTPGKCSSNWAMGHSFRLPLGFSHKNLFSLVEHLPGVSEALGSNPSEDNLIFLSSHIFHYFTSSGIRHYTNYYVYRLGSKWGPAKRPLKFRYNPGHCFTFVGEKMDSFLKTLGFSVGFDRVGFYDFSVLLPDER